MNRPSNRRHSWSWLPVAFSCCGLLFVGEAARRADAQEKPNFGPFETREAGRIIPNDATSIRRVPLTLIGQVETPAAEQVPAAGRTPDAAAPPAKPNSAPEFLPRLSPVEQKILDTLSEPTEVAFVDSPLHEALEVLKALHGIEIWLDKESLSAEGIATDTPVNLQLSGISLRSTLRLMLEPLALTYVIEDEVMKVTTQEADSRRLVTRTYPAGDLFETREEANELIEVFTSGLGLQRIGVTPYSGMLGAARMGTGTGHAGTPVYPASMQHAALAPETAKAKDPGAMTVSVKARAIVARQPRSVHDQIHQLLRDLREAKSLAPKQPAATYDAPRGLVPTPDTTRRRTLLDEFSPGLVPDANSDAPSFEAPASPNPRLRNPKRPAD